jgi:hypothetical protein
VRTLHKNYAVAALQGKYYFEIMTQPSSDCFSITASPILYSLSFAILEKDSVSSE